MVSCYISVRFFCLVHNNQTETWLIVLFWISNWADLEFTHSEMVSSELKHQHHHYRNHHLYSSVFLWHSHFLWRSSNSKYHFISYYYIYSKFITPSYIIKRKFNEIKQFLISFNTCSCFDDTFCPLNLSGNFCWLQQSCDVRRKR